MSEKIEKPEVGKTYNELVEKAKRLIELATDGTQKERLAECKVLAGDCRETLKTLPDESVSMCVTSPPYWGLRSYLPADSPNKRLEIGSEKTPDEYVAALVSVFREVRRVLKKDGTCWLNLGDCYAAQRGATAMPAETLAGGVSGKGNASAFGLKHKDLVGIPWRVAFALQADGWWLRSEITWCKLAPMPESVTDRPTSATEKIFLLSKSEKYWYDADAVRNPPSEAMLKQVAEGYSGKATKLFEASGVQDASGVKHRIIENARKRVDKQRGHGRRHDGFNDRWDSMTESEQMACGSNMRNYWLVGPEPYKECHFATFPSEIARRCILAGCPPGGTALDPFGGSGTTGKVALELGRSAVLCELNDDYLPLIQTRTNTTPGFNLE